LSIQAVTVVGFVADQSCREGGEEAVSEDAFDELAFVRRSAFDTNGERKTVIVGESDDFRPFAAVGGPDCEAPFFAPVKEASMKPPPVAIFREPATPPLERARCVPVCPPAPSAGNGDGKSGTADISWAVRATAPPVPKIHKIPLSTARVSCQGRPRPSERRLGCKISSISCHWASLS